MKLLLYQDATLDLPLAELTSLIAAAAPAVGAQLGAAPFEVAAPVVSFPAAYQLLPRRLLAETEDCDVALLFTEKPYDNNFFFEELGRRRIVSLWGWDALTTLPRENGVAYFVASAVIDHLGFGWDHDVNTGCINDFWWDKAGIDVGMRAAFICGDCRSRIAAAGMSGEERVVFEATEQLLEHLSYASRRNMSVLDRLREAQGARPAFDVFLCHNSQDKDSVRSLAANLRAIGLQPWLDEEQLQPGLPWQDELQRQIVNIRSAAVCVGSSGIGPWQNMELRGFLAEFVDRRCPVIPVILPTASGVPELPVFLRGMTWVDFRRDTPDPLKLLRWGITGVR